MRGTGRQVRWLAGMALMASLSGILASPSAGGQAPAPTPESTADWKQVSAGFSSTCAVKTNGHLYCWGQDNRNQLGNGGAATNSAVPVEVSGAAADWTFVSAGGNHACAIKTNRTLWCWGGDDNGQQGNGAVSGDQPVPVQVGTATDWASVSAGLGYTTCGRRTTGRVYCWGRDHNGQVGNGPPYVDQQSPVQVRGNVTTWTSVSTGTYHACGRRSNGRVYCWGDDLDGAVGDGAGGVDRPAPVLVAGNHTNWTTVSSGATHACGRRAGRLYCWGSDLNSALGNGPASSASRYAPVAVSSAATDWQTVIGGDHMNCGRRTTGRLFCWGHDAYGQIGTGVSDGIDNHVPTQVTGGATDWKAVTSGYLHTCALKTNGRLYCWGYGFFGQRGDGVSGTNANVPTPVEVA
jgi:alpha-tubulin suppressor-like RCC1 family protein